MINHHELCFGCGQANLFGLQLEMDARDDGTLAGRFFVKQDHQGPPGYAHAGVLAAALDEAMALLIYADETPALTGRLEIDLLAPAPVGTFVAVRARVVETGDRIVRESAIASGDEDAPLARATGLFVTSEP